ncbi:PTS glucose transporter subunit IIA [Lactiplantibacillus sp. WILCCON 0030]|uniref:PTS glucose transporter subunit IIA n=1 Tax=Lactiplantibacillus brownii TaxID=3069269 RepID=A0ABU1ABA3_9LACO|nr:PTS glucose transporter subunit IIA [Lactiplantibacillus brownii]MDQ7938252.1 PTS glucose transporter subunit IIA [Lactiplantibacillus brownii]
MPVTTSSLIPVVAPVAGRKISLTTVADTVLSCGMRLATARVLPQTDRIVAPAAGRVTQIAKKQHRLYFRTLNGLEVLIRLGVAMVNVAVTSFHLTVKLGEQVQVGQEIATMTLAAPHLRRPKATVPRRILRVYARMQALFFTATHRIAPEGNVKTSLTLDPAANHQIATVGPPLQIQLC